MIHRTWAGPKAKLQSAWNKRNSRRSNLPKGWGSPMLVYSLSGRKYGWWGLLERRISPLCGDRIVWNSCKVDPCTGRWRLQIFWRLSGSGRVCKNLIWSNVFSDIELRCFWRNIIARFGRRGTRDSKATNNRRRIRVSARAKKVGGSGPNFCNLHIRSHLHPPSPFPYHHHRTQSYVIPLYLSMPW